MLAQADALAAQVEALEAERSVLAAKIEKVEDAAKQVIDWHRAECGCMGATCGYGDRVRFLRDAVAALAATEETK